MANPFAASPIETLRPIRPSFGRVNSRDSPREVASDLNLGPVTWGTYGIAYRVLQPLLGCLHVVFWRRQTRATPSVAGRSESREKQRIPEGAFTHFKDNKPPDPKQERGGSPTGVEEP